MKAHRGRSRITPLAVAVFIFSVAVVTLTGCTTRDDSVSGRVDRLGSDEWGEDERLQMEGPGVERPTSSCAGELPPIVTPGEAAQRDSVRGGDEQEESETE